MKFIIWSALIYWIAWIIQKYAYISGFNDGKKAPKAQTADQAWRGYGGKL